MQFISANIDTAMPAEALVTYYRRLLLMSFMPVLNCSDSHFCVTHILHIQNNTLEIATEMS